MKIAIGAGGLLVLVIILIVAKVVGIAAGEREY